jgi:hypothetical protein
MQMIQEKSWPWYAIAYYYRSGYAPGSNVDYAQCRQQCRQSIGADVTAYNLALCCSKFNYSSKPKTIIPSIFVGVTTPDNYMILSYQIERQCVTLRF